MINPPFLYVVMVFQLTTSQGGRPVQHIDELEEKNISTHDLTRRSTLDAMSMNW